MKSIKKCVWITLDIFLFLFLLSVVSCVSIPAFAILVGVPACITSFVVGLKMCTLAAGIKKSSRTIWKNLIE